MTSNHLTTNIYFSSMNRSDFPLDAYLHRIGLTSMVPADEDGLEILHRAQVYAIPFENFDIMLGQGINLEPAALFEKLVRRRRGGYCFELNGLFLRMLLQAGFRARALLARVHMRGEPGGRTHQLELVSIGDRDWIADVGFGSNGLRAPLPLETGRVASQDGHRYRLRDAGQYGTMLQWQQDGDWRDLYSFDLGLASQADIELGNHFTSTHPSSFFTWTRVANLPHRDGRVSLTDLSLTEALGPEVRQVHLQEGQEYLDALEKYFGIRLEAGYDALRPLRREAVQ